MSEKQNLTAMEGSPPEDRFSSIEERIKDPVFLQTHLDAYERARSETREAYEELLRRIDLVPPRRISTAYYYISGVAAVLILVVTGYFFLRPSAPRVYHTPAPPTALVPAAQKDATLRLSDGRTILLGASTRGIVATEDGGDIRISDDGSLVYPAAAASEGVPGVNTLSTAKGRRFHVILPDGSQVWLNAGSRLTYFTRVGQQDRIRKAELEGEGYFDIAPDKAVPFHLTAGGTETVVLGTAFNVKAYKDESKVAVTLVRGAVSVDLSGKSVSLRAGQAAIALPGTGTLTRQDNPNTNAAIAWRDGYFAFDGPLDDVARELGRWYDVDVTLAAGSRSRDTIIVAATSMDLPLDSVLPRLEAIGAGHFKLEGKTLTVTP
jgi:hypothetical protein